MDGQTGRRAHDAPLSGLLALADQPLTAQPGPEWRQEPACESIPG